MTVEQSESESNPSEDNQASQPSVGDTLRAAREQAGLSQDAVAQELRMPLGRIQALESDDFSRLSSRTFVRGYLRAYGKLLDVDPESLLSIYQAQVAGEEEPAPVLDTSVNGAGNRPFWRPAAVVIALLLAGWLVSSWFLGNRAGTEAPGTSVVPPSESLSYSDTLANAPMEEVAEPGETTDAESSPEGVSNEVEAAPDSAGAAPENLADTRVIEQVQAQVLDRLGLSFSDECWLEVTDAQGDVLFTNLVQPGRELTLEGRAPFEVKLGNAQAVSVELNGEPVDLNIPPSARVRTVSVGEP